MLPEDGSGLKITILNLLEVSAGGGPLNKSRYGCAASVKRRLGQISPKEPNAQEKGAQKHNDPAKLKIFSK